MKLTYEPGIDTLQETDKNLILEYRNKLEEVVSL